MKPIKTESEETKKIYGKPQKGVAELEDYLTLYDNYSQEDPLNIIHAISSPFSVEQMTLMLVLDGTSDMVINGDNVHLVRRSCLYVTPESKIQFKKLSPDFKYLMYYFNKNIVEDTLYDLGILNNMLDLTYTYKTALCDEEWFNYRISIYEEVKSEMLREPYYFQKLTVKSYANIIFVNNLNLFNIKTANKGKLVSKQDTVFRTFIDLLNEYSNSEREVQFYADKLDITPKYLSAVCVEYSSKNASSWIDEYVISRAKALMREQKYTIKEISEKLNFPSQSFFGRYFKRVTGMSPKRYILGMDM